jgi:hypothetical protein
MGPSSSFFINIFIYLRQRITFESKTVVWKDNSICLQLLPPSGYLMVDNLIQWLSSKYKVTGFLFTSDLKFQIQVFEIEMTGRNLSFPQGSI